MQTSPPLSPLAQTSSPMSADSLPINPQAFSRALESLPLANLYAKAAELQNSTVHLLRSNRELKIYSDSVAHAGSSNGNAAAGGRPVGGGHGAENENGDGGRTVRDEGDKDCLDAISENEEVIKRMEERIELVREEVERRGARWVAVLDEEAGGEGDGDGGAAEANRGRGAEAMGNGMVNGHETEDGGHNVNGGGSEVRNGHPTSQDLPGQPGGRLTDEELQRQLTQRLGDYENEDGVHL